MNSETPNQEILVHSWPTQLDDAPVVTLTCKSEPVKIQSYFFTGNLIAPASKKKSTPKPQLAKPVTEDCSSDSPATTKTKPARFKLPGDMIKTKDRLFFLLQPPLESLIESADIQFPFTPFPYQYSGVAFLFPRQAAVLADEMGLGKTMQAITSIRLLFRAGMIRNMLLVCPKPLVTNWQREFKLWAPELNVCTIEGSRSKRTCGWQADLPIKVCNYELLLRDQEFLEDASSQFDLVVLDEAQRIKNSQSKISKTVRHIKRKRSWALTGTPIENSPQDLVGIFEFLNSGHLHHDMSAHKLATEARDYILRRTKDQVLDDMPPKLIRDTEIDLSPEQEHTYRQAEEEGVVRLNDIGDSLSVTHVFELILRLKQICNFDPATGSSSKLDQLKADLSEVIASGQKAIVFSQWVKTIERISDALPESNPLQYHGKIPSKKRDSILDQFKSDPNSHVLLMSYGAGSVGLNLQFCRYVFLFDRWWNPAVEDQAINRAHRLGSVGSVTVSRFLACNTIEERIGQVLEEKRALFDLMLKGTDHKASTKLTRDDIFGLFNLKLPCQQNEPESVDKTEPGQAA